LPVRAHSAILAAVNSHGVFLAVVVLAPLLGGCGLGKRGGDEGSGSTFGPGGVPSRMRARTGDSGLGATAGAMPGGRPGSGAADLSQITPEEEIVWTDPDDPDARIPELDTLLKAPSRGPWEQSETVALRTAVREGKCVLIWFTDSLRSSPCKTLDRELFSTPDFEKWAEKNLVRLRVDANIDAAVRGKKFEDRSDEMDFKSRAAEQVKKLKKRYRVFGNPTLVVLSPQGEVISRYRGYRRGNSDFLWGQIKSALISGEKSYASWRKRLEKQGYREWRDRRGRKVFAKLIAYQNGELLLIEPGGQRARTREKRLSDADRLWIEQKKREAERR
jgi:protein disulfide-isomerase